MGIIKYEALKGDIITFEGYTIPEHSSLGDYKRDEFWYNGFGLLPAKNSLMKTGEFNECSTVGLDELTNLHNQIEYGFALGRLLIPNIIRYNKKSKCYYGLSRMKMERDYNGIPMVKGVTPMIEEGCALSRYDADGNLISIRYIFLDDKCKVKEESSCAKSLYEFIEDTVELYNKTYACRYEDI